MTAQADVDAASPRRKGRWAGALGLVIALCLAALLFGRWNATNDENLRQRAVTAELANRWDEAEAVLSRLGSPSPADWLRRAQVGEARKQHDEALSYLSRVPADGPLALPKALLKGQVELRLFHARAAEAALKNALELDPRSIAARRLLVYLYGIQERRSELLDQFAAIIHQGPLTLDVVHHWCLSHFAVGDPDKIKSDQEAFVAADPDDRWSRLALAGTYRQLRLFDRASAVLVPLAGSNHDVDVLAERVRLAIDEGDTSGAASLLAEAPEDNPTLAKLRGRLALSRRDGAVATRFFRVALTAEPNTREIQSGMAQALRLSGDEAAAAPFFARARALDTLRELLQRSADLPELKLDQLFQLAAACENAGYPAESRAWYRLVLAADPLNTRAQQSLFRLSATPPATSLARDAQSLR